MPWGALGAGLLGAGASLWSNSLNRKSQERMNERNYQAQKEFYQNSVLWRKQDAMRSGINPIYALGASSASFSPSFEASQNTFGSDVQSSINTGLQAYYQSRQLKLQEAKDTAQIEHLQALTAKANAETAAIGGLGAGSGTSASGVLDPVGKSVIGSKKETSTLKKVEQGSFGHSFSNDRFWKNQKIDIGGKEYEVATPVSDELKEALQDSGILNALIAKHRFDRAGYILDTELTIYFKAPVWRKSPPRQTFKEALDVDINELGSGRSLGGFYD